MTSFEQVWNKSSLKLRYVLGLIAGGTLKDPEKVMRKRRNCEQRRTLNEGEEFCTESEEDFLLWMAAILSPEKSKRNLKFRFNLY